MPRTRCCLRLAFFSLLFAFIPLGAALADEQGQGRDPGSAVQALRQSSGWGVAQKSLSQALERAEALDEGTTDSIPALEDLGRRSAELGRPLDAVESYEHALALRHGARLDATAEAATTMERLAAILQPLERYDRAETLLRQALELRETLLGPEHAKVQALLSRLSTLIQRSRPADDEAGALLLRRLELNDSYPLRRQVAQYYSTRGDHERALEQLHEALALAENHPRNAIYWRAPAAANLAREYAASGNIDLAEAYLVRALETSVAQYGSRHPYLAWALRNLGEFYVEQERFVEAALHLERALEYKQLAYGNCGACNRDLNDLLRQVRDALGLEDDSCSETVAGTTGGSAEEDSLEARLATLDERTGALIERRELALARETAMLSLELREQARGAFSIESATSLKLLARVARELKRTEEEEAVLERYLATLEQHLSPESSAIAGAVHLLGRLAERADNHSLALEYFTREVRAREAAGQNLALARALKEMGEISREAGDPRRAGESFMRAADVWELMAGRHAADYVRNRVALSESYRALELTGEAESTLSELLSLEERRDPARPDLLRELLEPLRALYADSGRDEQAEALRIRLGVLERSMRAAR